MKNRIIKFRVWDRLTKSYVKNTYLSRFHNVMSLDGEFFNLQNGSGGIDYEVQQFTGLLDKNQKEIYEGDIVKFFTPIQGNKIIDVVCFSEGQWETKEFCAPLYECLWDMNNEGEIWLEVIGNINENIDLVK